MNFSKHISATCNYIVTNPMINIKKKKKKSNIYITILKIQNQDNKINYVLNQHFCILYSQHNNNNNTTIYTRDQ